MRLPPYVDHRKMPPLQERTFFLLLRRRRRRHMPRLPPAVRALSRGGNEIHLPDRGAAPAPAGPSPAPHRPPDASAGPRPPRSAGPAARRARGRGRRTRRPPAPQGDRLLAVPRRPEPRGGPADPPVRGGARRGVLGGGAGRRGRAVPARSRLFLPAAGGGRVARARPVVRHRHLLHGGDLGRGAGEPGGVEGVQIGPTGEREREAAHR
mmetsp:Transcript_42592/g.83773  ORF Transcript_42592/g.83773 Transcript_42592/m.83773 type:complete len:209 (-) Transcript_42592:392-1018(-)